MVELQWLECAIVIRCLSTFQTVASHLLHTLYYSTVVKGNTRTCVEHGPVVTMANEKNGLNEVYKIIVCMLGVGYILYFFPRHHHTVCHSVVPDVLAATFGAYDKGYP